MKKQKKINHSSFVIFWYIFKPYESYILHNTHAREEREIKRCNRRVSLWYLLYYIQDIVITTPTRRRKWPPAHHLSGKRHKRHRINNNNKNKNIRKRYLPNATVKRRERYTDFRIRDVEIESTGGVHFSHHFGVTERVDAFGLRVGICERTRIGKCLSKVFGKRRYVERGRVHYE